MDEADSPPSPVVDFHNHFVGSDFRPTNLGKLTEAQRPVWERINARLSDPGALIASLDGRGISARVISAPPEFIQDCGGDVPPGSYSRINDAIAEFVSRRPGRLYGLASVDTDWPVIVEEDVPRRLHASFAACGLDAEQQRLVAGGNALRLLGVQ